MLLACHGVIFFVLMLAVVVLLLMVLVLACFMSNNTRRDCDLCEIMKITGRKVPVTLRFLPGFVAAIYLVYQNIPRDHTSRDCDLCEIMTDHWPNACHVPFLAGTPVT